LSLNRVLHPLTEEQLEIVRDLEVLEPLNGLITGARPRLAVEVSMELPPLFDLGKGYVRLGRDWLDDPGQVRRGFIIGVLKREHLYAYEDDFELEVVTDFLLMAIMPRWSGLDEVKLSTSAPTFGEYCKSPRRSLARYDDCMDPTIDRPEPWGFQPLLSAAL